MQYDELSQRYQAALKQLLPVLSEVSAQTLHEKIAIESDDPASLTGDFAPDHEYPLLKVTFGSTTDVAYEHFFLMDKSLAGLIFSWMAGGETPEEIVDEHLEAVRGMVTQVLGQLQAALEGQEYAFTAGEIQLAEVASQGELGLPEEGLTATYRFTRGDEKEQYVITYGVQGESAPEEVEGTTAEEAAGEVTAEPAEDLGAELAGDEGLGEEAAEVVPGELPLAGGEEVAGVPDVAALFEEGGDEGGLVEVSPAEFEEFAEVGPMERRERKIDLLLDVELDVAVELGRRIMHVEEILKLGKGSVIELNKLAGEPVDVLVNGKKLAEGEVVVVEDHFGIRLTHLVEPKERIKSLGK
ncbi:MAG: flagellar motor switch protein FliN [Candidatus Neomarinimicrobiota bacterium]